MKKIAALFVALTLAPFTAEAQTSIPSWINTYQSAVRTTTSPTQEVIDYGIMTISPGADSQADFRAGKFVVEVPTNHNVTKVDALSGYASQTGSGAVASIFGGTLQYFNRGPGSANWAEGGMFASRNRGPGYILNSIGSLSTAENARAGTMVGIKNAYGAWGMTENYGRIEWGRAGYFALRNYPGGDYDSGAGIQISIENEANIDFLTGLRIGVTNSGTIGSAQLIYVPDSPNFTPTWVIYSAEPAPSYFAGDIRAAGAAEGLQAQITALKARVAVLEAQ